MMNAETVKSTGFFKAKVAANQDDAKLLKEASNVERTTLDAITRVERDLSDLEREKKYAVEDMDRDLTDAEQDLGLKTSEIASPAGADLGDYLAAVGRTAIQTEGIEARKEANKEAKKVLDAKIAGAKAHLKAIKNYYDANFTVAE